nr:hypothetical protein [Paenibacillus sambharensis]
MAVNTGFSQSSYFAACLGRIEGMTPQQFRTIHKLDQTACKACVQWLYIMYAIPLNQRLP